MDLLLKRAFLVLFVFNIGCVMAECGDSDGPAFKLITAPGEGFSGARAQAHVDRLASPAFEGRQSGLAGGDRAEDYVAAQFKGLGLLPMGDQGSYFQSFPMLVTRLQAAEMELLDNPFGPITLTVHEDFFPVTHSGSGDLIAEAVFAGHGISKPDKGWDDYGESDVKGKIVVLYRDRPPVPGQDWSQEYSRNYTVNEAYRRGAAGLLFLQGALPIHGAAIQEEAYHPDFPVAYIAEHVAEKLIHSLGETLKSYKADLPRVMPTGQRIRLRFEVERIENGRARNVVGLLPGNDRLLSRDIIVIGGHLDHLGLCPGGQQFPGAQDNASGTAVMLELARALVESGNQPARSLLFAGFAAEEQGLLGSIYMAEHLPVEKDRIGMMINMDCLAHGGGKVGFGGGDHFPCLWRAYMQQASTDLRHLIISTRAWGGSSDQAPFRDVDIPVFSVWTSGEHRFYHLIDDEARFVTPEQMEPVGKVSEDVIRFFANHLSITELGLLADGFQAERLLLTGACQVDFLAPWKKPLLETPPTPGHISGSLWCLSGLHAPTPEQPISVESFFSCLEPLQKIQPPAYPGTSFKQVRSNGSGHGYTYLPCLNRLFLSSLGPNAGKHLADLGVAFVITDLDRPLKRLNCEGLTLVARETEPGSASARSPGGLLLILAGGPEDWLAQAAALPREDSLFILPLGESMKGAVIVQAVAALEAEHCHLDLSGIRGEAALLVRVQDLLKAGLDEDQLADLLGGNLLDWNPNP